jgi:hypothetical protein
MSRLLVTTFILPKNGIRHKEARTNDAKEFFVKGKNVYYTPNACFTNASASLFLFLST